MAENLDAGGHVAPGHGLDISVSRMGPAVVLEMHGELDLASADAAEEALGAAAGEQHDLVVADLSDVGLLDSTGLKVLLDAAAKQPTGGFGLVCPGGMAVRGVLSISGALDSLATFESRQDLRRHLGLGDAPGSGRI